MPHDALTGRWMSHALGKMGGAAVAVVEELVSAGDGSLDLGW
jgi:hypothetical protein